jgi:hypothetical protein
MVSISPIGSTADSPLRSYTHHGDGMSPNYGTPAKNYDGMGSLNTLPGGRMLHGEGVVKDVADFTRKLYQRGTSGITQDNSDASSGNYVALNHSAYKLHTEVMPSYSHKK